MRLVIDTSIIIDFLRGSSLGEHFFSKIEKNKDVELFLPTIVIFELFSGKSTQDPEVVNKILRFLRFFQTIDLDIEIARRAGELYRDVSKTLPAPDYIIAASCFSIGGTVVTLNKKHFEKIPGLPIYSL